MRRKNKLAELRSHTLMKTKWHPHTPICRKLHNFLWYSPWAIVNLSTSGWNEPASLLESTEREEELLLWFSPGCWMGAWGVGEGRGWVHAPVGGCNLLHCSLPLQCGDSTTAVRLYHLGHWITWASPSPTDVHWLSYITPTSVYCVHCSPLARCHIHR